MDAEKNKFGGIQFGGYAEKIVKYLSYWLKNDKMALFLGQNNHILKTQYSKLLNLVEFYLVDDEIR